MKLCVASLLLLSSLVVGHLSSALSLKTRIVLPNVNGRMDHFAADVKGQRLFVSALGNHTVEVLDVENGKRVRALPNLDKPQGLYFDSATNQLFIATGNGNVSIYDGTDFQRRATIRLTEDADNVRYDSHSGDVVVGCGGENALRPRSQEAGRWRFSTPMESEARRSSLTRTQSRFSLRRSGPRAFVNIPDRSEIQVADVLKKTILTHLADGSRRRMFGVRNCI